MLRLFRFFGLSAVAIISLLNVGHCMADSTSTPFQFESIKTLDEMSSFIRQHFPLGSFRSDLRRVFVTEGRATLKIHPREVGVEKYIYDINLCNYYIWRWNISADYDADGKLQQAYLNGNIIFPNGKPKRVVPREAEEGKQSSIYQAQRTRPEAYKGESSLGFILFDRDSDLKTIGDQSAIGAGPSRVEPVDMGNMVTYMVTYIEVDPWRSIFDSDRTDHIVPYQGDCAAADKPMQNRKTQQTK